MKKVIFTFIIAIVSLSLFAQKDYNEAIQQGDAAFKSAEYTKAIRKYLIARAFDSEMHKIVQAKLDAVYNAIDTALLMNKSLQKELEQLKKKNQIPTNTVSEPTEVVTTKPTPTTVNPPPRKPQPKPLIWNDFLRLYEKPSDQWFISAGYSMNVINNLTYKGDTVSYGYAVGLNFGGRHSIYKQIGFGYQAGIGLGFNGSGKYIHWTFGGKFYPWNCFFISANYGAISMISVSSNGKIVKTDGEQFTYYKEDSKKFYNGFTLLVGADICFGKNTTNKVNPL